MKNTFLAITFCFLLFGSTSLHAQNNERSKGSIKGSVVTVNNQPAAYVTVSIPAIKKTLATDEKGAFGFKNLNAGVYVLNISLIGHEPLHKEVVVEAGKTASVNFQLQISDHQLSEIIIRSQRHKVLTIPSTSLRLQTPLLDLPQNIQEIPADVMNQQMQLNTAAGFTRNVSGVRTIAHQEDAGESIYIRGYKSGSLRNGLDAQGTFAPLPADIFNIERVEFVKGPAGFMMGNGEAGGFYNVVTKSPLDVNAASVKMMLGSFSTYRTEVDVNQVLTKNKKLQFRLNTMAQSLGSYILYTGRKGVGIAPSLKYELSDRTTVTLQYQYLYNSFYGGLGTYSYSQKGFKDLPRSFTFNDPAIAPTTVKDQNLFVTMHHKIDSNWTLTGQLGHITYKMRGSSIYPAYNGTKDSTYEFRQLSVNDNDNTISSAQFFVNGNFSTGAVSHRLLAGVGTGNKKYLADWSVMKDTIGGAFNIYDPVYGKIKRSDLPVVDRSVSLAARGLYRSVYSYTTAYIMDEASFLNNRIRLSAGARYTYTTKTDAGNNGKAVNNKAITPRLGVSVTILPQTTVYVVYDQSFQEQAGLVANGNSAEPSRGRNNEIGVKKIWGNNRWITSLAFYNLTKTNILTSNPQTKLLYQTGEARSKGIEFDFTGEVLPNLNLTLNYAYTDAKVTKDSNVVNIGNNLNGTARHITNGWLSYQISNGKLNGLGFNLGYRYEAKRAAWPVTGNKLLPDNYFTLDGGLFYGTHKYSIALLVENITDKYNYTGYYPGGIWGYNHYGWKALTPTSFRMTIGYKL